MFILFHHLKWVVIDKRYSKNGPKANKIFLDRKRAESKPQIRRDWFKEKLLREAERENKKST
ncbi:MAG: hypothetical protein D3918_05310 [Candidatus Electrothrix sp. AX2]|nr:hypothetical protein [Candidatus Electrothrix gigas]